MDNPQTSIASTVEALESTFGGRWGVWLSDTAHWWASRRDTLSAADLSTGCVPFLRTDTSEELAGLIREQEALCSSGTEHPAADAYQPPTAGDPGEASA